MDASEWSLQPDSAARTAFTFSTMRKVERMLVTQYLRCTFSNLCHCALHQAASKREAR